MNDTNNPWAGPPDPSWSPPPQQPYPVGPEQNWQAPAPDGPQWQGEPQWQQGPPMFAPVGPNGPGSYVDPTGLPPMGAAAWNPQPRSGRKKWIFGGVATVVVLLLVVGGVVASKLRSNPVGASSPENAALDVLAAFEAQDSLKLADAIAPGELDGLSDIVETTHDKAEGAGLQDGGGVGGLLQGITVSTDGVETEVEEIRDDLAKVTFTSGTATVGFDPDETNVGIRDLVGDDVAADEETVDVRDFDAETVNGDPIEPFVMTVKVDDRWFLSPLYTAGEYAAVSLDEPRVDDPELRTEEFGSPEDAAAGFVEAVAEAVETRDVTALAAALPAHVGRAIATYQPVIERGLTDDELGDRVRIDIRDASYSAEEAGRRASVTVETLDLTVTVDGDRTRIEADGDCIEVTGPDGDSDELCGDAIDVVMGPGTGSGALLQEISVVKDGTGWHVDPVATLLSSTLGNLEALTSEQLLYLLGVGGDAIEVYARAEADATLEIGGSTTVTLRSPFDTPDADGVAVLDIDVEEGETVRITARPGDDGYVRLALVGSGGRAEYDTDYSGDVREYEFVPNATETAKLVVIGAAGDSIEVTAD